MNFICFFTIWYVIGLLAIIHSIIFVDKDPIKVKDIIPIIFVSLFGLVIAVVILYSDHEDFLDKKINEFINFTIIKGKDKNE